MQLYEVTHSNDGRVWINGMNGLLGRFSRMGIDVHCHDDGHCLDCRVGETTPDDWEQFLKSMQAIHSVDVAASLPENYSPFLLQGENVS